MIEASIVIVTHGQWAMTEQCLRSLERALGDKLGNSWEVVVIDNNSPDETPQRLPEFSERIRFELLPENRNFAGGCNLGAEIAEGEALIFLNNDTEVSAGGLETLVEQTREPEVAAAGCRLLFPDGTVQHAGVAFLYGKALGGAAMPQHVLHHHEAEISPTFGVFETDSVTAACFAVRRQAFREVGGFDERYRNGLEDIDLCLKLRTAGHRIVYRGDVTVIHHEGASRGAGEQLWASPEKVAAMAHNDHLFVKSWAADLEQDDELAARVWDAGLRDDRPERNPAMELSASVVFAQSCAVGESAAEARSLVFALDSVGARPAAGDVPGSNVVAKLSGPEASILAEALERPVNPDATIFYVPGGARDYFFHPSGRVTPSRGSIVRLGLARTALNLENVSRILAASRAVAAQLVADGFPAERVSVMPPLLSPRQLGAGGSGVIALLPVHDRALTLAILAALRDLATSQPIRLLPSVFDRRLAETVTELLPHAELMGPCSCETRFAEMSAAADLLIAADPLDPFDRRALVAASVGTPALSFHSDGPASDVLGSEIVTSAETLSGRVIELLQDAVERERLQQTVVTSCDLGRIGEHISQV
jgi:GT2 family glycosyltransferase